MRIHECPIWAKHRLIAKGFHDNPPFIPPLFFSSLLVLNNVVFDVFSTDDIGVPPGILQFSFICSVSLVLLLA